VAKPIRDEASTNNCMILKPRGEKHHFSLIWLHANGAIEGFDEVFQEDGPVELPLGTKVLMPIPPKIDMNQFTLKNAWYSFEVLGEPTEEITHEFFK
jgi:hypothetical protein